MLRSHGTTVAGLTTKNAMVMTSDGIGTTEPSYEISWNVVKIIPKIVKPATKVFRIDDKGKMFFAAAGYDDLILRLRNALLERFDLWKWERENFIRHSHNNIVAQYTEKSIRDYAEYLRDMIDNLDEDKDERPTALIGGFDPYKVGDHKLGPLLYNVSSDFVIPVHESKDKFASIGTGASIARMALTPYFGASRSRSLDTTIFLAQRAVAQASDDETTGGFVETVAIKEGEIYDYSRNDIMHLRRLYDLGPVRRSFI